MGDAATALVVPDSWSLPGVTVRRDKSRLEHRVIPGVSRIARRSLLNRSPFSLTSVSSFTCTSSILEISMVFVRRLDDRQQKPETLAFKTTARSPRILRRHFPTKATMHRPLQVSAELATLLYQRDARSTNFLATMLKKKF